MDFGSCAETAERSVAALPGVREDSVSIASATLAVIMGDDGYDGAVRGRAGARPGRRVGGLRRCPRGDPNTATRPAVVTG
ncbi:MAG: hypothetical protein H0U40_12810 [Chloroflexia bacterium]|nr:hypothetical protein [Chloroflexia bacterium]